MENILVIDDDSQLTTLLDEFFSSFNYNVITKNNPINGIEYLENNNVNIIILDIMMPEMEGFQVLRKIREFSSTPVIMLTARGEVTDKIVGLELGADDYMAKPFEPRELLARVQSIIRRSQTPDSMVDKIEFENLLIDKLKQEIFLEGELVQLSTTEYQALILFVEHPGKTLDREFLVENLRGITWQSYDRSVDVLVSRLRQKLGETPSKTRFIKTIHGTGYKFIGIKKN